MTDHHELAEIRRDISKLGVELGRGMSAASILIEQTKGSIAEVGRRLEQKVRDDHVTEVERARELGEIRATLDGLNRDLQQLAPLPTLLAKLEAGQDHLKGDVTGKHEIEKVKTEAGVKKEEIASDERKAKLQFWGAIAVVALPGMIAMVWQILGFPGNPPTTPSAHPETPSISAPPHHE